MNILKDFNKENCQLVSILVESVVKLSELDEGENMNPILYRKLVGKLR